MRVEVIESLPEREVAAVSPLDDAAVSRALKSFFAAIQSDDSMFVGEALGGVLVGDTSGTASGCAGDFVLRFRGANLASNRTLHFSLVEKLLELLKGAGSGDSLVVSLCLTAHPAAEAKPAGFALRLRLAARGNSPEQAGLRWGLGLAHVQQALLFTSRYLRQQMAQSAD
jgi:hypothetical protein